MRELATRTPRIRLRDTEVNSHHKTVSSVTQGEHEKQISKVCTHFDPRRDTRVNETNGGSF